MRKKEEDKKKVKLSPFRNKKNERMLKLKDYNKKSKAIENNTKAN
jgi:hypothetical protein